MKKGRKAFIGILAVLITLWLVMFSVDYTRCAKLKAPVFATEEATRNSITEYKGIGYTAITEKGKGADPISEDVIIRSELRLFGKIVSASIA